MRHFRVINHGSTRDRLAATAEEVTSRLYYRGLYGRGVSFSRSALRGTRHTRLSVIKRSQTAKQLMSLLVPRLPLRFSGEVYNFPGLSRQLLTGRPRCREDCDTEGRLAAMCVWGITGTLQKLAHMCAIGISSRPDSGASWLGVRQKSNQLARWLTSSGEGRFET